MSDENRIKHNQVPYQEFKSDKSDDVDPEKFKKIMKVDQSEDAQKKRKRPLKEEEGDDDDADAAATTPTDGLFSSFMDESKSSSVFDPQGGGVRNISVSEGGPTTSIEDDEPQPLSNAPPPVNQDSSMTASDLDNNDSDTFSSDDDDFSFQGLDDLDEINFTSNEDEARGTNNTDVTNAPAQKNNKSDVTDAPAQKNNKSDDTSKPKPTIKVTKKKSADIGIGKNKEGKKVVKKMAKKGAKKVVTKTVETPETEAEKKLDKKEKSQQLSKQSMPSQEDETEAQATTKEAPAAKKIPSFTPASPEDLADRALKALDKSHSGGQDSDKDGSKKKRDEASDTITPLFPHASVDNAGIPSSMPMEALAPVHEPGPLSPLTKLPPEVYTLFEQMAGVITVESHSDRDTTSVMINMPGSVFDGSEVVFNRYKSAQDTYNLELKGSSQAVDLFTENLPLLEAAFKKSRFNFEVNILPPSLAQKSSSRRVKRKSSDNKKGKK